MYILDLSDEEYKDTVEGVKLYISMLRNKLMRYTTAPIGIQENYYRNIKRLEILLSKLNTFLPE